MTEAVRSVLLGTAPLSVMLAAAVLLTARRAPRRDVAARERVARLFLLAVAAQCLHVIEEYLGGFAVRYPELLDLPPWPPSFFVVFNVAWIAVWLLAAVGLRANVRVAWIPAWFFAMGMILNLIAHPLLALRAGGYFPGLLTSPLVGVLGLGLGRRLMALTRPPVVS